MNTRFNLIRSAAAGAIFLCGAGPALAAGDPAGARKAPARPLAPSVQTVPPIRTAVGCAGQPVLDPGIEATTPGTFANPNWGSTSTNFSTALCDASCGGVGPHAGTYWAWFGGAGTAAETSTLSQTLIIPAGSPRYLNFWMWISAVSSPSDSFKVKVDGTAVLSLTSAIPTDAAYRQRSIDISAFADGASHTILFELIHPASASSTNIHIDDITSDCTALPVGLQSYSLE